MTQKEVNQMVLEELKGVRHDFKEYMECNEQEHIYLKESIYKLKYGIWIAVLTVIGSFAYLIIKSIV